MYIPALDIAGYAIGQSGSLLGRFVDLLVVRDL